MKQLTFLVVILGLGTALPAWAGVLQLGPVEAVVVSGNGGNPTLVGLKFDFSKMRQGEGRHVDLARIEWPVGTTGSRDLREFRSYVAKTTWSAQTVREGQTSLEEGDGALEGIVAPGATSTAPAILTLDMTKLVESWVSGKTTNYGVILSTQDVDATTLENALSGMKLKVWYGFHKGSD